jgi:hypothetical protein
MRSLVTLVATIAALTLAAPAQAEILTASGGSGAGGHKLLWTLQFDDAANTVTIDATHTKFDGSTAIGDPLVAGITLTLNNGQKIRVDLLTGELFDAQDDSLGLFDGTPGTMLNTGPRTRTGVRLQVSAGRGRVLTFNTSYVPPAG